MSLHLKFEFRFDENLLFNGFLPETREESVKMQLRDGRYNATLYMPNRKKQLSHLSDIPEDKEELKRWVSLRCSGLTLELEDTQPDPEVITAIQQREITEKTEKFASELFELVVWIHTRAVDYFHNIVKQTWIEPLFPELRGYPKTIVFSGNLSSPQMYINHWRASWLDSAGKWQGLMVGKQHSFMTVYRDESISQESWERLAVFIEQGKRAPMLQVLIANSLQHAREKNGRLAVIESVIALESAIKQLLPKVVVRLPGVPSVNERYLDRLFEKAGLRSVCQVVFPMIQGAAGLDPADVGLIVDAIEVRNRIIHGSQRDVEAIIGLKYVNAVRRVCELLETWARAEVMPSP